MIASRMLYSSSSIGFKSEHNIYALSIYKSVCREWCIKLICTTTKTCINDCEFFKLEDKNKAVRKFNYYYRKYIEKEGESDQ